MVLQHAVASAGTSSYEPYVAGQQDTCKWQIIQTGSYNFDILKLAYQNLNNFINNLVDKTALEHHRIVYS